MRSLPLILFAVGFTAGLTMMTIIDTRKTEFLYRNSIMLAKLSYVHGCVDQGGKFQVCQNKPALKRFDEMIKKLDEKTESVK